jgi:hypothetical protein
MGAPIFILIWYGIRASFLPRLFTSNSPSMRIGTTGIAKLFASIPIPAINGRIFPSLV